MEFPVELANQDVVEALIKHSDDDATVGLRIDACLKRGEPSSWGNFLDSSGLVEKETLNDVARSGACQFSAVADQLFRSRPVTEAFRPDVYLRLLALHCVSQNQDAFQDFMLHAAPVTRQQRQRGGGGVDMEEYARRMASSRCDGDHITLQALCDALKVNINVVKWTRAGDWLPIPSDRSEQRAVYSSEAPQTAATSTTDGVMRPTQSVFVADTLRPRNVTCLDPRTHRVQLPGRTLWLSLHGEAHFRSLRVKERGAVVVKTEEAASGARLVLSGFPKLEEEASSGMGFVGVKVKTELREVMPPFLLPDGVSGSSVDVGETERGSSRLEVTAPAITAASGVVGDVRTGVSDLGSSSDLMGASARAFVSESLSAGEVPMGTMPATREGSGASPGQGTPQDGAVGDKGKGRAEKQQRKRRQPQEDDEEEDVVDCSICMCAVTRDPDAASLDKCMHAFHFKCIVKWGETTNQCPMCKVRFNAVTRLRDKHVKRFRARRRKGAAVVIEEEEEEEDDPVAARAVCMHCGEGGEEDRLILCDGSGCGNGAHTFCCGLAEVPSGEWFCPQCQARREAEARRREANARRDAILVRAWAVESNSEVDESQDVEEEEDDESGGDTVGVTRTRRSYSGVSYDVAGGGLTGSGDARRGGLGLVMDDDRVDAFERGLVNSSGESNGEEGDDDGVGDGLEMEDGEFSEEFDHGDSPLRQPFTVDLVSSGASEGDSDEEEEEDDEDAAIGVARVARASGARAKSSRSSSRSSSTRTGSGSGSRSRRTSSIGSRSAAGTKRRSIRKILGLTTTARSRGRGRGRGRGKGRGRTRRRSARGRAGVGNITGASLNAATAIVTTPSSVARGPGPNLWPRVLASATSVVNPRHTFASVAQEEEEEKEAEDDRGRTGGGSDGGLVAQSWADAERAVQMARGSVQNRGTSSALRDKREARVSSSHRNIAGLDAPDSGSGSGPAPVRSSVSTARSRIAPVGIMSTSSSTAVAGSPTTRRFFKRPRMMHASSPIMESPSSPPPQSLIVSRPGMSRVGSLSGVGGTVEGVVGVGRRSCESSNGGSGSGRAASRVQLLALVQRLRGMAIAERGRWRAERISGRFTGAESVAMSGREGVDAVFEELKRAALDGDDTARETLLSSKLLPVLRLWLEPAADGRVSFLLAQQRSCLLEVLMALPVKKDHLKESGIGKLMVSMAADPSETRENRELMKQIVKRWSQLVFNTPRETPSVSSLSMLNQEPSRVRGAGDIMSVSSVGGGECSGAIGTQNARRAPSLVPKRPEYGASRSPALPSYIRRFNITGSGKDSKSFPGSGSISSNTFLGTLNRSAQVGGGSSGGSGRGSGVIPKKPRQLEESNAERHRGDSDRGEGARFERRGEMSRLDWSMSRLDWSAPVSTSIVQELGALRSTSGPARRGVTDSLSSCSSSSPFTTSRGLPRASSSVSSIPAPCASSASRGSPLLSQRSSRPEPVSLSAASGHRQQRGDRPPGVTGVVNNASGSSSAETHR